MSNATKRGETRQRRRLGRDREAVPNSKATSEAGMWYYLCWISSGEPVYFGQSVWAASSRLVPGVHWVKGYDTELLEVRAKREAEAFRARLPYNPRVLAKFRKAQRITAY